MAKVIMDKRFMVEPTKVKGALKKLDALEVRSYGTMDALISRKRLGIAGQDVEKVAPEAVEVDGLGNYRVDLEMLVPILVAAVQELSAKVAGEEEQEQEASAEEPVKEAPVEEPVEEVPVEESAKEAPAVGKKTRRKAKGETVADLDLDSLGLDL